MDHEYNFLRFSPTIPPPSCFEIDDRTDVVLQRMLERIREDAVDELQILAFSPYTSDFERTMRLLYLFQRDFLSSKIGAKILDGKLFRDIFYQEWDYYDSYMFRYGGKNLSPNFQLGIILAFHLLFVVMGGYIFYFTYRMYRRLQEDWIASLLIFVGADMFLVSPLEVLFLHVFLPSLIHSDIQSIVSLILAYIEKCKSMLAAGHPVPVMLATTSQPVVAAAATSTVLGATGKLNIQINSPSKPMNPLGLHSDNTPSINSTQYFFSSNRVAQYFPDSTECKIILSYSSVFPPGHDLPPSWLRPDNGILVRNHRNYATALNQAIVESMSVKASSKKNGRLSRKYSSRMHNIPEYLRNNRNRYESYFSLRLPLHFLVTMLWLFLNLQFYNQELLVYILSLLLAGGVVYVHYYLSLYNIFLLAAPTLLVIALIVLAYIASWTYYLVSLLRARWRGVQVAPRPMDGIDADVENAEEYEAGMKAFHRSQVSSKSISRSIFEVADPQMENDADMYDSDFDDDEVVVLNQPAGIQQPPRMENPSWNMEDFDVEPSSLDDHSGDIPTVRQDYNADTGSPGITILGKKKGGASKKETAPASRKQDNHRSFAVDDFDDDDFGIGDDDEDDDIDDIDDEGFSYRHPRIKPNMRAKLRLNMKKVQNVKKFRPRK